MPTMYVSEISEQTIDVSNFVRNYPSLLGFDYKITDDYVQVLCPFHNESNPSFLLKGTFGYCFSCQQSCNLVEYIALKLKLLNADAEIWLQNKKIQKYIVPEISAITPLSTNYLLDYYKKDEASEYFSNRGFEQETIETLMFGYGYPLIKTQDSNLQYNKSKGKVFTIPISENNQLWNFRYRRNDGEPLQKYNPKYWSVAGQGNHLYLLDRYKNPPYIILCEGELKAALLYQYGFPAISVPNGAGFWHDSFTTQLGGITIYVVFDNDDAGRKGILSLSKKIKRKIIPIVLPEAKGVDDYFNLFTDKQEAVRYFKHYMNIAWQRSNKT